MPILFAIFETILCCSWITVYVLALYGTIKYSFPLIPAYTQIFIATFEFSVFFSCIYHNTFGLDYVSIVYFIWTILEFLIMIATLKLNYLPLKNKILFVSLMMLITSLMCYLVAVKEYKYFFSYFNTFIGEVIWLRYVVDKKYPNTKLVLIIFIAKFIGDTVSIPVYIQEGIWLSKFLCVAVPIVDLIFIDIYFLKARLLAKRITHRKK